MERIDLNVEERTETGKGVARALRRDGYIPGVVYRAGKSTALKINKHDIVHLINSTLGEQVMVDLKFSSGKSTLALLKEYQVDPVKGELLHTDFYEVSLKEKIRVTIGLMLQGEPVGVKKEGGVLRQVLSEIEVECLPDNIPTHIEVDVTGLGAGQNVHVRDLSLPGEVRILTSPEEMIATVVAVSAEEEAVEEAVEGEAQEPEVVKKGKKEEGEEGTASEK